MTKQVAATEARLKVRLLNRNTRGVSLTESGALYYEKCKSIVRETRGGRQHRPAAAVAGARPAAHRHLGRPSAAAWWCRWRWSSCAKHPQVQVDLSFEDRYIDLVAQGIDVAVRMGKLADSTLGARFLGMNPWVMVASPDYLKKQGTPKRPADLSGHDALIYSSVQGDDVWRMHTPRGEPVTVPVSGRAALQQPVGGAGGGARRPGHRGAAALRGRRFAGRAARWWKCWRD